MKLSTPLLRFGFLFCLPAALAYAQCTFTLTPSPAYVDAAAQNLTIQVAASLPNCTWFASPSGFASIPGSSAGTGSSSVTYAVLQNSAAADRSTPLNIAGQSVQLTQRFTTTTFSDVAPADSDFDAVNLMRQKLITSGCSTQPTLQYCPGQNVTRGQAAILIVRAILGGGANADTFPFTSTQWFNDVPPTHPYFKWIQKMKDLGITAGCAIAQYCPDSLLTRGQMAAFIIRSRYGADSAFAFSQTPLFTDVAANSSYFSWVQKMKQAGITAGCAANLYCPNSPVTRGQMAIIAMRGDFNLLLPAGSPVIASVSPSTGTAGNVVSVTITGQNTNFLQGLTTVSAGSAIPAVGVVVTNPTSLTAQFSIPPNAAAAPVSVVVQTISEEAVGPNLFTVTSTPPPGAVTINNFSFLPPSLNIATGAQVTWTNAQAVTHTVTSDTGAFASQNIVSGGTFSQTLTAPGTYAYHCAIHTFMKGTITVQ